MDFLPYSIKIFKQYKSYGEKAMAQIPDASLFAIRNERCNSIAIIIQHLSGNMISRWTDFLSTDGEKSWRDRDGEFELHTESREALMKNWEDGWACTLQCLESLTEQDLQKTVSIRNENHTVMEAIMRQIAHYANHVGQIIHIAKEYSDEQWVSLTIPKKK